MISEELNAKIWQVAESGDDQLTKAFIAEHPECKAELLARQKMVTTIKGSKPTQKVARERFMPSPDRNSNSLPRWAAFAAASTLIAGAVLATVGTLRFLESQNQGNAVLTPNHTKPLEANNGKTLPKTTQEIIPTVPTDPNSQLVPGQTPPVQELRLIDTPVTIVASNIRLDDALNDIALQAGIRLNSAPGMPNPNIQVDFRDVPAIEVLRAIGQQLEFTPMIETSSSILLVPARDPNAPESGLPGLVNPAPSPGESAGLLPIPTQTDPTGNE
ncbi:hypothetical protein CCB80_15245 [Armatimonadetes bacterium Uphvl-Ar1]|nr:hypothetical protein CCB80_15245 [Armatimonadetes bacterium Uphvl-Ar1]